MTSSTRRERAWIRTPLLVATMLAALLSAIPAVVGSRRATAVPTRQTWAWGYNGSGQVGVGHTMPVYEPQALFVADPVQLSAAYSGSALLDANGNAYGWGNNYFGAIGDGSYQTNRPYPALMTVAGVIQVERGDDVSAALRYDGTVWAAGYNYHGGLGTGQATTTGCYCLPYPTMVQGLYDVVEIAVAGNTILARKSDGTVWGWGSNHWGTVGSGSTDVWIDEPEQVPISGVASISGDSSTAAAVTSSGAVWMWGHNNFGQLGTGLDDVQLPYSRTPMPVLGVNSAVQVELGFNHALALMADGTVRSWGSNRYGERGDAGPNENGPTPGRVVGLSGIKSVSAGGWQSMAVDLSGTLWVWGNNLDGQLGFGEATDDPVWLPTRVDLLTDVALAQTGAYHSVVFAKEGRRIVRPVQEMYGLVSNGYYTSDPVYPATGNFAHRSADLTFPDQVSGMDFTRMYNSMDDSVNELGRGWASTYTPQLTAADGDIELRDSDGKVLRFEATGPGGGCAAAGPDAGGYTCSTTEYQWLDTAGGTDLVLGDDDVSGGISLPFTFPWYGSTRSQVFVGSNGLLCFAADDCTSYSSQELPDPAAPNDVIACLWGDLNPTAGGVIRHRVVDGVFVVSFEGVPHYGASELNTFQFQLTDTGEAKCMLNDVVAGSGTTPSAIGIENIDGSSGVRYGHAETTEAGLGIRFGVGGAGPRSFTSPSQFPGGLVGNADGTYTLAYRNGETLTFNSAGRLAARDFWDGQHVGFTYSGGRLSTVTSSTGYSVTLAYTDGKLTSLTSSDGRSVEYSYGEHGQVASFTDAAGGTTAYGIDGAGHVADITDPDGVEVVSNEYVGAGRVLSQTLAGGRVGEYAYDDALGTVTVTEAATNASTTFTYDDQWQITKVEDALGELVTMAYDDDGNVTSITDRRGGVTTQTFDDNGNLLTRVEPGGVSVVFEYDDHDRLVSATDGVGLLTTYSYEADKRLPWRIVAPGGGISTFDVSSAGLITRARDADGVTTHFGYDSKRNMTSATTAAGTTMFGYDAAGNRTSVTSPMSHTATASYDGVRRLTAATDPAGATLAISRSAAGRVTARAGTSTTAETYSYDSAGRLATVTDAASHVTTYAYDAAGNVDSVARPGGAVIDYGYDAMGRIVSVTDPTGVLTSFGYDEDGSPTTSSNPAGTTTRTLDSRGRTSTVTDATGRTTTYTYDNADRVTSVARPGGATVSYDYDSAGRLYQVTGPVSLASTVSLYTSAGRVASVFDEMARETAFTYDNAGRLTDITFHDGSVRKLGYDADGRVISDTSPELLVTAYGHDAAGRITSVTDPSGAEWTRTFTPRGEVATVEDPEGGLQQFAYDARGLLAQAVDANNGVTQYGYDGRGNVVSRTSPGGAVDTWTYDKSDRVLTAAPHGGGTTTSTYDPAGRLATVTDASGRSATYSYDAAGRVLSRLYGGSLSVAYTYDTAGRRATMTDPTGTTSYEYDAADRMTKATFPGSRVVSYEYFPNGNRRHMWYPDGSQADFSYDVRNRLAGLSHPAGSVSYSYDDDGRLLHETLPGGSRDYTYDDGRLMGYTETLSGVTRTWGMTHDDAGRVASITDGLQTQSYLYDDAGQLVQSASPLTTTTYSYDGRGNRTAVNRAGLNTSYSLTPGTDQVTSLTEPGGLTTQFTYDASGRRTKQQAPGLTIDTGYDGRGLPTSVAAATPLASLTSSRSFDGDGDLASVEVAQAGSLTRQTLTWDKASDVPQVLTIGSGLVTTNLLYGMGRAMAVQSGSAKVFSQDILGSELTTAQTAGLVRAPSYGDFGQPAPAANTTAPVSGSTAAASAVSVAAQLPTFGYRGEMHLGNEVHLRARQLDPSLGRFKTRDPLDGVAGLPTVANQYAYANNDPAGQVDPLGLSAISDHQLRLGAAIGLTIPERRDIMLQFFEEYPGTRVSAIGSPLGLIGDYEGENTGFGLGLIQFGGWEFNSGRFDQLHGSDWWKAVNGWMMLDIQEAFDILSIVGPERAWAEWRNWTTRGDDPGLAAWIAYATSVSGESSPAARQAALWTAHQRSLHNGIRAAGSLLYAEDAREQEFINYVIRNVDLAALNRMSTSDGTMGPYLSQTYPDYGQVTDHALALVEARSVENLFACGGNIAAMMPGGCVSPDELENIGVFSTRW